MSTTAAESKTAGTEIGTAVAEAVRSQLGLPAEGAQKAGSAEAGSATKN